MNILSKEADWGINHFGTVEIKAIKKEVIEYIDEWLIDVSRQKMFQTHEQTFMYQLKELDYAWNLKDHIRSTSPNSFKTELANHEIKKIYQDLELLIEGKVVRSEVINMSPHSRIRTHKDVSDLLYLSRRFHIPIITNKKCIFIVEEQKFHLEEGNLYELNNRRFHSVENFSDENRIHLIIDILPNEYTENIEFL
jgi:aspartyl/asparaginyl beta-hydroxylase (cupin superfamily)